MVVTYSINGVDQLTKYSPAYVEWSECITLVKVYTHALWSGTNLIFQTGKSVQCVRDIEAQYTFICKSKCEWVVINYFNFQQIDIIA